MPVGLLGTLQRGQLYAELEPAALGLRLGEMSGIVESSMGFHILYCVAIEDESFVPFAAASLTFRCAHGRICAEYEEPVMETSLVRPSIVGLLTHSVVATLSCVRNFARKCDVPAFVVILSLLVLVAPVAVASSRDVLLEIVTHCVDPVADNYCGVCRWPRHDAPCAPGGECRKATEVWALSADYVAIRDVKMCGCPTDFIHGLVLPRYPVTGVEDSRRPAGIWQFAWEVGSARMGEEGLALVVNPEQDRGQDQLHVHIVQLRQGILSDVTEHSAGLVSHLAEVWQMAKQGAAARGLSDYGVLVLQGAAGGFNVVVTEKSPETAFTRWQCH